MTETSETEDAGITTQPSPKRPDRRPAPPEAQAIPPTARLDYLDADGEVAADDARSPGRRRSDSASSESDHDPRS